MHGAQQFLTEQRQEMEFLKNTAKIWSWEYDLQTHRITWTNMYSLVVLEPGSHRLGARGGHPCRVGNCDRESGKDGGRCGRGAKPLHEHAPLTVAPRTGGGRCGIITARECRNGYCKLPRTA